MMNFPSALTPEEEKLKDTYEKMKKIRKTIGMVSRNQPTSATAAGKVEARPNKKSIEDAEVATEEVKKKIKSGAITVKKASERQTFKRKKDAKNYAVNEDNESDEETDREVFEKGPTLFIRGYDLVAETLHSAFEKYGTIEKLTVDDRKKSAHITFTSVEEAELAVNEMNDNLLNGMTVRCSFAREHVPLNPNTKVDNDSESILKSGATFRIPKKKRSEEVGDFSSPMQRRDDRKFGSSANTVPSSSFGNDNAFGNFGGSLDDKFQAPRGRGQRRGGGSRGRANFGDPSFNERKRRNEGDFEPNKFGRFSDKKDSDNSFGSKQSGFSHEGFRKSGFLSDRGGFGNFDEASSHNFGTLGFGSGGFCGEDHSSDKIYCSNNFESSKFDDGFSPKEEAKSCFGSGGGTEGDFKSSGGDSKNFDSNYGRGRNSGRGFRGGDRSGRGFRGGDRGREVGNRGRGHDIFGHNNGTDEGGFDSRGFNHGNRTRSPDTSGSGFGSSGFGSSCFGDTNFGNDLELSTGGFGNATNDRRGSINGIDSTSGIGSSSFASNDTAYSILHTEKKDLSEGFDSSAGFGNNNFGSSAFGGKNTAESESSGFGSSAAFGNNDFGSSCFGGKNTVESKSSGFGFRGFNEGDKSAFGNHENRRKGDGDKGREEFRGRSRGDFRSRGRGDFRGGRNEFRGGRGGRGDFRASRGVGFRNNNGDNKYGGETFKNNKTFGKESTTETQHVGGFDSNSGRFGENFGNFGSNARDFGSNYGGFGDNFGGASNTAGSELRDTKSRGFHGTGPRSPSRESAGSGSSGFSNERMRSQRSDRHAKDESRGPENFRIERSNRSRERRKASSSPEEGEYRESSHDRDLVCYDDEKF